jgi:hypothetical protein
MFWTLNQVLGVWFLAAVVNHLDFPGRYRSQIFALLYLAVLGSEICVGLNYTAFRFTLCLVGVICVFHFLKKNTRVGQLVGALLVLAFVALQLLVSPEIAVAFSLGSAAFFWLYWLAVKGRFLFLLYLGMLAGIVLLLYGGFHFEVFATMQSFSSGGFNFPIILAPHILFFLFSLAICSQLVASSIVRGEYLSNTMYALAVSAPLVAAALGRCDAGHVFWNGLAILMVGMLWASGSNRAWRWYGGAFVLIFIGLGWLSGIYFYQGEFARATINLVLSPSGSPSFVRNWVDDVFRPNLFDPSGEQRFIARQDASQDLLQIPPQVRTVVEAPFAYTHSHNPTFLDFGYYWGLVNALDSKAVDRKINELARHPDRQLILPPSLDVYCKVNVPWSRQTIRLLFLYPFNGRAVHPQSIFEPLCAYIRANYVLSVPTQASTYRYEIWSRRK